MSNNPDRNLWPFPKKGLRAGWRHGKVIECFGAHKVFQQSDSARELRAESVAIERSLQSSMEQHLESVCGLQFVADIMKSQKMLLATSIGVLALFSPVFAQKGPFGLERGMTREQIIHLVGANNVEQSSSKGDTLVLNTVPKPHPAFELYKLYVSPADGLLKISALGEDIRTNGFGEAVRIEFSAMREAICSNYGQPSRDYDFIRSGSLWTEPQDWTMGLLKQDRDLESYWMSVGVKMGTLELPNKINVITLNARVTSLERGYLRLNFEFDGWDAYLDSLNAKQNTVLK